MDSLPIKFTSPLYTGKGASWRPTGASISGTIDLITRKIKFEYLREGDGASVEFKLTMDYAGSSQGRTTRACRFSSEERKPEEGRSPFGGEVMILGTDMDTDEPKPMTMVGLFWDEAVGMMTTAFGGTFDPSHL